VNEDRIRRYARQLVLKEGGGIGQKKLLEGSAFLVGAGGLGCPAALYLAAAGVGRITIADPDLVDLSNLHRQIAFTNADVGLPKAETLARAASARNPDSRTTHHAVRVTPENARDLFRGHSVVLDGSDSVETKFAANDAAVALGIPIVVGGVLRWSGQTMTVLPGRTACYRCVFETPPAAAADTCESAGILGPAAGVVGSMMALEALKILLGAGKLMAGRMAVVDLMEGTQREVPWPRRKDCAACGRVSM
jgi:adenylyltransferase/sulfurtransferase